MPTETTPSPGPLTQGDIEEALRALGLGQGDAVEVHVSLSRVGRVEGGAATLIAALQQVVGDAGAIVMSAYLVSPALPLTDEEVARGIQWKVRVLPPGSETPGGTGAPTGMGAVADLFCQQPGTVMGQGPHRVCAWGRDANRHSEGYQYLRSIDGLVLLIGVGIDRCSSMHLAEQVPLPDEIEAYWRLPEDLQRDYPSEEWAIGYGGPPGDSWGKVLAEAERRGWVRHGRLGSANYLLFRVDPVVSLYEHFRRTEPFALFGVEQSRRPEQ
jgi:aminoglycoside 3-N-acetyltransferase